MALSHRLVRYRTLAAVPAVVTSAAVADTYDASGTTPVTASTATTTFSNVLAFSAAGLRFSAGAYSNNYRSAALMINFDDRGKAGPMKWFIDGSQSRVIDAAATADAVQSGFGGWRSSLMTWVADLADLGDGYLGFSVTNTETNDTVNGFIQYSISVGDVEITVTSWAYNLNRAITMPADSGGGAVPGFGGLAALACGAAGLRGRRRSRN